MTLAPGQRLGPYEILAFVAAGGMGEVYRARDTRLGRSVAVKVVGPALANHAEARRRFEYEARLAAQLDHPRIGAVYDVGRYGEADYFVMEFIEANSLARRLAAGPLPMRELIGVTIEIASALAYAHARGVLHRDLQPGNILLTTTGVKVVDFGLGTLRQGDRPSERLAALETAPPPEPEAHVVTGTPGFVPPERLQGLPADHRADIFAFGAVLYEMASGRRAFDGASPADVNAAILTADPPPLPDTAAGMEDVEWIVRRCLRKRPDDRWQSMADIEAVLRHVAGVHLRSRAHAVGRPRRPRSALGVAAIAAVALGVAALLSFRAFGDGAARASLVALTIPAPPGLGFTPTEGSVQSPQFAVSPDGRSIAFVASGSDGVPQIWIRPIDSTDVRPVPGTARATYPFWSPSNRSIGFFADGDVKRVDLDGGPPRVIASAPNGRGGAWSAGDVILFAADAADVIRRVTASGEVVAQTAFSKADTSHRWPQFLPDGRHFVYFARSADDRASVIRLASLDTGEDRVVVRSGVGAVNAGGYLLYVEDDALLAAQLDVGRARVIGDPVPIVDHVATSSNFYGAFSAAAQGGVIAYATKASAGELLWVGRDGRRLATVARGAFVDFRLSPDQRSLAVAAVEPRSGRADLRLLDLVRGTDVRLTTSPATDASPVFSPDGSRLVFRSNRERIHDLYLRPAGEGEDRIWLKSDTAKAPTDWTRDSGLIVYHAKDERTHHDIWAAPVDHPDQAQPLVRTDFDDVQGQVSPSGRWLAYVSNQSSQFEVYVQPLHGPGRRWQISSGGGSDPKWRADEREIFYIARDGRLMAVDLGARGEMEPGTPHALFPLHDVAVVAPFPSAFDVQPDGQRFLVREPIEVLQTLPLTVLVNWSPLVRPRAFSAR